MDIETTVIEIKVEMDRFKVRIDIAEKREL